MITLFIIIVFAMAALVAAVAYIGLSETKKLERDRKIDEALQDQRDPDELLKRHIEDLEKHS